jgi:hypothetical protein
LRAGLEKQWPTGSLVQVAKIKPSDCDLWLTRCAQKSRNGFSASSRNAHVQILKECSLWRCAIEGCPSRLLGI